jgi:glycosyltransferase involved in cell wall biosynthesis
MACGTPVLASNTTSIPEVAGDAAELVDPTDTDAITKSIYDMLSDKSKLQNMSRAGFERCNKFSWRKAAREVLDILKLQVMAQ